MRTDFENLGLSQGPLPVDGRKLYLTVDFEAFMPDPRKLWNDAMRMWAEESARAGIPASFFVALENAVQLRYAEPELYADFAAAMRELESAGNVFHPHNHYVFDQQTGATPPGERKPPPRDYRKRGSLFYDVVYRHGRDFGDWMRQLRASWDELVGDIGLAPPGRLAFRAGGWDYGSTREDLVAYIDGLGAAGFQIDSSACRGDFGTSSWRVGAPFANNTFTLPHGIEELAPTLSMAIGEPSRTEPISIAGQLARQPRLITGADGAAVVVLHFDHLFHESERQFAISDPVHIRAGIRKALIRLQRMVRVLRLEPATIDATLK